MSEQPSGPGDDELAKLRPAYTEAAKAAVDEMAAQSSAEQSEATQTDSKTGSDTQALKQFIDGLEERLAEAGEEIDTGTIACLNKYDGQTKESVSEPVENPGAIRIKSWHEEEDGTDVTQLSFGPKAVKESMMADGGLHLTYTRDIAGELIEVKTRVHNPSPFRSSFDDSAQWDAGEGFSGLTYSREQMSPEQAQDYVSGVLGRFDELLAEANL